jgi:hypothetical protein
MAVRIQFRRGTAAEWASANPTLVAGELGYEVDTAKFKIGDGSTVWASLDYAGVNQQDIEDAVASVVDFAPETLDTLVELAAAINDDPDVFNTLSNAISDAESNAIAHADNAVATAQTIALTYANVVEASAFAYTDNAVANLISSAPGALDTLNELAAALGDDPNFATTISTSLGTKLTFVADTHANFLSANVVTDAYTVYKLLGQPGYIKFGDGTTAYGDLPFVSEPVINSIVEEHNSHTQNVHGISDTQDLVYQTDLTNAITTVQSDTQNGISAVASDVSILDGKVGTLETTANTQENTLTTLTNSVDSLEGTAENLDSRTESLENTIVTLAPLSGAELSSPNISSPTLANAVFTGDSTLDSAATIEGLTPTELGHLSGVTSAIQTQLDDQQDDIDLKAPLDSPTFGGSVVLPVTTTIGNVVGTEISSLENVSSNIQDQLNAKLGAISAESIYAPLSGPTFTGNVSLPSTTSIGSVSETEIGYLSGLIAPIQTQLSSKATTESPTFTGTVTGITASMVGLTNVDNTSDLDKPVSNATQTALDDKLDLAGGTMTGKITLDGDPTQALHAVTKQYVDSVEAGLITRPAVRAATTGPLPSEGTSVTYDNGTAGVGATLNLGQLASLDIDGITSWSLLDGILVKDQDNKFENGRYVVDQIGNGTDTDWILRRCSLCDTADEIPGSYIFVLDGTTNEQTGWVQHVADPATFTVGTDDIDVYQFAGAGAITAGNNISVSGNEVSVISEPSFFNATVTNNLTVGSGGMGGLTFPDGTVQSSAGVPSLTQFTEKTANYTLDTLDHQDNVVEMNSGFSITFTIPTNATLAWPIGASMDIIQTGSGQVNIANAVGVTLNYTPGNYLRTQWSSCTIMKRGADSWILYGDLTATSYES